MHAVRQTFQGRPKAQKAKRPEPPAMPGTILDGLVLSGKLAAIQGIGPIVLTPRQPYHAASGSWLGCVRCTDITSLLPM